MNCQDEEHHVAFASFPLSQVRAADVEDSTEQALKDSVRTLKTCI